RRSTPRAWLPTLGAAVLLAACGRPAPPVTLAAPPERPVESEQERRGVRATGTIQPVRFLGVQVPRMSGQQSGRLTLTRLVPNGSQVRTGDVIAEFDRTEQLDKAREAQAKFDALSHQVAQRAAQNRAEAAKRAADLATARA